MVHKNMLLLLLLAVVFSATPVMAQVVKYERAVAEDAARNLPVLAAAAKGELRTHLLRNVGKNSAMAVNPARVAAACAGKNLSAPFVFYSVPAMSDAMRLPESYPDDGLVQSPVTVVAARDEYEAGSFVVYPLRDLGKVQLSLSNFKSADGDVFPASQLDLKVVKVWYQNRNGWISYFVDTGLKQVPELLLNDEDLIKVDTEKQANYARVGRDGKFDYRWISAPAKLDSSFDEHWGWFYTFKPMKEDFQDAPTLRPVALPEGKFKQFFLTVNVPANAGPGVYTGNILLHDATKKLLGTIPVRLKVLDFTLPSPKTAFDLKRDYLVTMYNYVSPEIVTNENGGDRRLAEKQILDIFKNMRRHNKTTLMMRDDIGRDMATAIRLLREAGMSLDPMIGGQLRTGGDTPRGLMETAHNALVRRDFYQKHAGHNNIYLGSGDEPPARWVVKMRPHWEIYHKLGFKFFTAGSDLIFNKGGYIYDMAPMAGFPEEGTERTRKWNEVGAYSGWYSSQHVGVENPAYVRKQNGLVPYQADYSVMINYAFSIGPWNDLAKDNYKPMALAYATRGGLVDTLAWEGFREGVDDIRYATLLRQLAAEAVACKTNVKRVYAGRKALQFMAELNAVSSNADTVRLEMINHIQHLMVLKERQK